MQASPFSPLALRYPSSFPYLVFAGPCSAETQEQTYATAQALRAGGVRFFRASLWKPRTRPGSFEGVGREAYLGYDGLRRSWACRWLPRLLRPRM